MVGGSRRPAIGVAGPGGRPSGGGAVEVSATAIRAVVDAGPAHVRVEDVAVDRLARWLLMAVVLDLLVTRFVVRLAIFIPKGEPWATLSGVLGRVGATTDVLVPIVGVLVLAALLAQSSRAGRRGEQAMLVAVTLVALGGFALVILPATPGTVLAMDVLIVAVAATAGRSWGRGTSPPLARMGMVALAAAIALAALGRALAVAVAIGGPVAGASSGGPTLGAVAQFAFVIGAALIGLGGIIDGGRDGKAVRRWVVLGAGTALILVVAWMRAPAAWDSLIDLEPRPEWRDPDACRRGRCRAGRRRTTGTPSSCSGVRGRSVDRPGRRHRARREWTRARRPARPRRGQVDA